MAPLQGLTLGERQKYYNQLVKEEQNLRKEAELNKINFEDDDVDNMIKIDIACKERNVEYILDVFKCEDMLYVSRAINKSTWIMDPEYSHIINPKYLHSKLFPLMNAKAVTKLMLHLRRYLRDEVRVKAFYKYVHETNPKLALRWLENCSLEFIESVVTARLNDIPLKLMKRLCKKSINILRVFVQNQENRYVNDEYFEQMKFYLKKSATADEFLDLLENHSETRITLNAKYTHILMKRSPGRVKQNFEKFCVYIDVTTFVKYIKTNEVKSFLKSYARSIDWKDFEVLSPFLDKLPREGILEYISTLFYWEDYDFNNSDDSEKSHAEKLFNKIEGIGDSHYHIPFSNVYRWYQYAPFDIAFRDIKKFIFAESLPEERHKMLIVLLTCAKYNMEHVKTVLQYYHDRHINEPYLHKITFVQSLLKQFDTFRFDDSQWSIVNVLYQSLEVYIESSNKVQDSLSAIIVHNVLCDLPVHEVVVDKFEVESLKNIKEKLSSQEQDKVFEYLYNLSVSKLNKQKTSSETGMHEAIKLLKAIWNLLKDWDRVETHHRFVIDKVSEFGRIHNESTWIKEIEQVRRKRRKKRPNRDWKFTWRHFRPKTEPYVNIPSIYSMLKSYRKDLFENSLVLHASEEVLLNAIKHDPGLLTRCAKEVDGLRSNDEVSLNRFLSKLRVYWSDSLATEWADSNMNYLQKSKGYRSLVRGILILSPQKKTLDFINQYVPIEKKIHWSEINESELSMQKHIAKNMHIARPQLPAEVVLWYAKGDYLQYALLSLNTMYYNLRSSDIPKYIDIMLNAPVSLQKHGIRLAFVKYKTSKLINISPSIWKRSRNASIRAALFTSIFNLLCKEKKVMAIKAIWAILSSSIDDLNKEENKSIYRTLGKVCDVPLIVVGDFFQKAYLFLETLPEESNKEYILDRLINNAEKFIEHLDPGFVEKTLLVSVHTIMENRDFTRLQLLSAHLLCSKDLQTQMQKYNNMLQPVIDQLPSNWADHKIFFKGFKDICECICNLIPDFVFNKKMIMPIEILTNIRNALFDSLNIQEHYIFIRRWQLTIKYLQTLVIMMKESDESSTWESIRTASTEEIASMCYDFLVSDEERFGATIHLLFKDALHGFFENFSINTMDLLLVLEAMLDFNDEIAMYLLAIELLPTSLWGEDVESKHTEIKKKIYLYPTEEVTMHYCRKFNTKFKKKKRNNNYKRDLTQDATNKKRPSWFRNFCNVM